MYFGTIGPHVLAINGWLFVPALYIATIVHELGHLAGVKLAGMPMGGAAAGALVIFRSKDRWTFRLDESRFLGGFAYALPLKADLDHPGRYAWWVAGGPIASVLFTGLCAIMARAFGPGGWSWIDTLLWSAAITVALTIMPFTTETGPSDGARLWQLWRDPEGARQWMTLCALHSEDAKGVRPRDWDSELMEQALQIDPADSLYPGGQLLGMFRNYDMGNVPRGLRQLENALAARSGSKAIRRWCFLNAASASASERHNPAQARVWLERARKVDGNRKLDADAIEADIAMAEGRFHDALRHLANFQAALARQRADTGVMRFIKDGLAER